MDEYFEANRKHWDELVPIHQRSPYYDLDAFHAGKTSLHPIEIEELGDVEGKRLLHMQCHFGMDTLSLARRGAIVTGADFSERAIEAAWSLAAETGINARFLVSTVYELPEKLDEQFDTVYTSYGVLCWLPDIRRWGEVVAHFVRPGGIFYMVEFHPAIGAFESGLDVDDLRVAYPYFAVAEPLCFEEDGSYADRAAKLNNRVTYSWPHPVSEVLTALIDAGLRIEFLHEFPFTIEQLFPFMLRDDDGLWHLAKHDGCVPMLYSIRARKD